MSANRQIVGGGHVWHGEDDDWWTRMRFQSQLGCHARRLGSHARDERSEAYFGLGLPHQSWLQPGVLSRDTLWDGVLYKENKVSIYYQIRPKGGLSLGVFARYGDQVDFANSRLGDQLRLEPFIDWNINRNLFLRLRATLVQLDTKDGEEVFDAGVYDIRATWQFNRRSFIRLTDADT